MDKSPLQQMIDLWNGINQLHVDVRMTSKELFEMRHHQRLANHAKTIWAALLAYQLEGKWAV